MSEKLYPSLLAAWGINNIFIVSFHFQQMFTILAEALIFRDIICFPTTFHFKDRTVSFKYHFTIITINIEIDNKGVADKKKNRILPSFMNTSSRDVMETPYDLIPRDSALLDIPDALSIAMNKARKVELRR